MTTEALNDRAVGQGSPNTGKARAMLNAFASVGVRSYDVTITDIEGEKVHFQLNRRGDELARSIGKALDAATELQQNFIIRPRATGPKLIQLDDLDKAK